MISNYQLNKGILDNKKGPITDIDDFKKAMGGEMEWENVRIYRELKKIRAQQATWVCRQFEGKITNGNQKC